MSIEVTDAARRSGRWLRRGMAVAAIALGLCLGGAVSLSEPFQEGTTRIFGRMANGIRRHPRVTLAICLGAVATLWIGIGALAAAQELRSRRTSG